MHADSQQEHIVRLKEKLFKIKGVNAITCAMKSTTLDKKTQYPNIHCMDLLYTTYCTYSDCVFSLNTGLFYAFVLEKIIKITAGQITMTFAMPLSKLTAWCAVTPDYHSKRIL